ncbi:MAG: diguanylate cyclase [Sphingomonas fennica]
MAGALLRLAFLLLALAGLAPLGAVPLRINDPLCQAMTARSVPDSVVARIPLACGGEPSGYRDRSLWVGTDIDADMAVGSSPVVLMNVTRVDRIAVFFLYGDGRIVRTMVHAGDFGPRWRVGGQLSFMAPTRDAALTRIVVRLDNLGAVQLLRLRILPATQAGQEAGLAALIVGGALTLLLLGVPYNVALAMAARRVYLVWHAAWSGCVLVWGLVWSQVTLLAWPRLAGTLNSQIASVLASAAVSAATICYVSGPGQQLPRPLRLAIVTLAGAVLALGLAAGPGAPVPVETVALWMSVAILSDLGLVTIALAWGCWRGHRDARDSALAWALPMAVLASTMVFDYREALFGGGAQVAVLLASALQTVWLSLAATKRLSDLRFDRDAARAAELEQGELARRDPLTGLLNRRGFIERARDAFGGAGGGGSSFALLLIDVDHFKTINDRFGHETGDVVLCRIATRLTGWEGRNCIAGRLGGEEFLLGVGGLDASALAVFADEVRRDLGAVDHGEVTRHRRITVSIGAAAGTASASFQKLYGLADRALYDAKHGGRDRVVIHGDADLRGVLPDQLRFRWDI